MDTDYHPMHDMISGKLTKIYAPINIGNDCWFGTGCYVSKGCKIANGTTFAAHSVVRSSVTRENICAGNPAVIIEEGYRISEETFSYHPPVKKKAY